MDKLLGLTACALLAAIAILFAHRNRTTLKEFIMTAQQDAVDAVVAQLTKAKTEILTEISNLQAQIDAGQPVDLTALKAAAQSLDDMNADAPVDEPPVA